MFSRSEKFSKCQLLLSVRLKYTPRVKIKKTNKHPGHLYESLRYLYLFVSHKIRILINSLRIFKNVPLCSNTIQSVVVQAPVNDVDNKVHYVIGLQEKETGRPNFQPKSSIFV